MGIQIKSGFVAAAGQVGRARAEYQSRMRAAAEQVRVQAETLARSGTLAGVYNTLPGKYVRTDRLLESLYATVVSAGSLIAVEVGNTAPYASLVEYGSYGQFQSPEDLRALSEAAPGLGVLYLGRSGLIWQAPNPAITRAAVVSTLLLAQASSRILQTAMAGR